MRKWKALTAILLSSALLVSAISVFPANVSRAEETSISLNSPSIKDGVTAWDFVEYGQYRQENTNGDGQANDVDATQTPEITNTPESTNTPEITSTPESTNTPEITSTPEITNTPGLTNTPKPTNTSEAANTPKATSTPEPTDTLEPIDTPEPVMTKKPSAGKKKVIKGKPPKFSVQFKEKTYEYEYNKVVVTALKIPKNAYKYVIRYKKPGERWNTISRRSDRSHVTTFYVLDKGTYKFQMRSYFQTNKGGVYQVYQSKWSKIKKIKVKKVYKPKYQ